jgi:hypothetical protein
VRGLTVCTQALGLLAFPSDLTTIRGGVASRRSRRGEEEREGTRWTR